MGMDLDYVAAKQALKELGKMLSEQPHDERAEMSDDICHFLESMLIKYGKL